ncbi:hypothetical protein [Microbulbifer sp. SSSA005]
MDDKFLNVGRLLLCFAKVAAISAVKLNIMVGIQFKNQLHAITTGK